jgi:NTE family protein
MRARDFSSLKIPFVAVATDLEKGEVYPIKSGPIAVAVHASAALPPYFHSVSLDGRTLVDGGVTAPLPVSVALTYRPQVVIAVNVSGSLSPKMPKNSISEVARSYSITLNVLEEINGREANVVIIPDVGSNGTFNISNKQGLFDAGSKAATKTLPQIRKVLAEKNIIVPASR